MTDILKLTTVYNTTLYARKDDMEKTKRLGRSIVKLCKRNGEYHKEASNDSRVLSIHLNNIKHLVSND